MNNVREHVEKHYGRGRVLDSVIAALRETGKDLARLRPEDLAPVEPGGWARRAYAANGFGAATLAPENDEDPAA